MERMSKERLFQTVGLVKEKDLSPNVFVSTCFTKREGVGRWRS